jgi:hypothetical protein
VLLEIEVVGDAEAEALPLDNDIVAECDEDTENDASVATGRDAVTLTATDDVTEDIENTDSDGGVGEMVE